MARTENEIQVKQEIIELSRKIKSKTNDSQTPACIVNLSSSDSESDSDSDSDALSDNDIAGIFNKRPRESRGEIYGNKKKKNKRGKDLSFVLPVGFLDPLPAKEPVSRDSEAVLTLPAPPQRNAVIVSGCKQFWKAGNYDETPSGDWESATGKFLNCMSAFLDDNAG